MKHLTPQTDTVAQFLDAQSCADRYGFSVRHWHRLVDSGKAPSPTRFGRLVRWSLKALEAWEAEGCPTSQQDARRHSC